MSDTNSLFQFRHLVAASGLTDDQLCDEFAISIPVARRWRLGEAEPLPGTRELVSKRLAVYAARERLSKAKREQVQAGGNASAWFISCQVSEALNYLTEALL